MTAMELVERLRQERTCARARLAGPQEAARRIVTVLLDESPLVQGLWEAQAARERATKGSTGTKPRLRVRRSKSGTDVGLTPKEVAALLNLSERGVREIERRAFRKLLNHPSLRQVWLQYLSGELDEHQSNLTPEEVSALFRLARTAQEWRLLEKVTRIIQS